MDDILREATEAIKEHPYNFLYVPEVQRAFRGLEQGIKERTEETNTLVVSLPATSLQDKGKISMLPLSVSEDTDSNGIKIISFDWFTLPDNRTGFADVAMCFVSEVVHALDALPESSVLSEKDVEKIREKYTHGTKIRIHKMMDDFAPKPGTEFEVDLVDDYGQIHVKGLGLAIIPGVDEFEVVK